MKGDGVMKKFHTSAVLLVATFLVSACAFGAPTLRVVTTLPDYEVFARLIGGDRVSVSSIVLGDQDAHFIRPKPSFVNLVRGADVLVSTGLDLELWLPTVIDMSANRRIRSGRVGYVSTSQGIALLEKPKVMSKVEGGVHIYGNPHLTCSPINMKTAARNIAYGLAKNDAEGKSIYMENLGKVHTEMDRRLFGEELVKLLGSKVLCDLAAKDRLIPFLEKHKFRGKPLVDSLGGWLKKMLPLRGAPIVTYHKNWIYFVRLFGLEEAGTVEPKPGIPPSPKHVADLIKMMKERKIRVILAANYFDEHKIRTVANAVGAEPVIVPLYVGGVPGVDDYFQLVDYWVDHLLEAAKKVGLCKE